MLSHLPRRRRILLSGILSVLFLAAIGILTLGPASVPDSVFAKDKQKSRKSSQVNQKSSRDRQESSRDRKKSRDEHEDESEDGSGGDGGSGGGGTQATHVVLGYNDLGMHCMNPDFSEICILPPYNTLRAQVLRRGEEPRIVTSGVSVQYRIPGNTTSSNKTDFWQYAPDLFGVNLPDDVGLTGNGMAGEMVADPARDWVVTGIPITPLDDNFNNDPFQLSEIVVRDSNGTALASTAAVVPVSWEISCDLCHNTPGISVATDILRKHDTLHGTTLEAEKPVLCARCHADPALGAPGEPGVSTFSAAMHSSHAPRMSAIPQVENKCYACHPGVQTECQRDVHLTLDITCTDCHGDMAAVGDSSRVPWVDEPTCAMCHEVLRPEFDYEQPGKQFKDSVGHGGVHCAACHGPQHAVGPAVTDPDNVQAILHQGHAGVINDCRVCHGQTPEDRFFHSIDD